MINPIATGRIKIIQLPQGFLPQLFREASVGLTFNVFPSYGFELNVLKRPIEAFRLPHEEALDVMRKYCPRAFQELINLRLPRPHGRFLIRLEDALILDGSVTRRKPLELRVA